MFSCHVMLLLPRWGRSLHKGIRGYAAGMGYVFTSSGIYYGHKFKILSLVLGYHLPVVLFVTVIK